MPADRGAHWLAAMIEVNAGDPESAFFGPLSDESKLDPDPEIFNRLWNFSIAAPHSRLYNIMRTETISFDEYIKNAHMKGALTANTLLTTPLEVGQGLYARIYDLPWFAEVEKNIGRILRHFRLSDQIDVIEVENSANPDLIHFITTSLSRQLFADDGTEDHEYFITVSKKVFCQPKNRKGRKGEIERLIPEAKPLSKLEEAALSILQELAESACTSAATGYERDVLVTNSPNDDELPEDAAHGEGYNPIFDSHLPDAGRFLSKEFFKPFAEGLPYPALVACDAEKYSRFKPFEYVAPGRTRRMTFTECIPLYPEELQFASDYSLEELFDKWGFDTFSPIPTKRKNVAEEFFKGALIDPKKIRPLLPEGVEDADCFVSVKVLREGARIGCCMHLLMPGADHALWMFRAEGEETDNMSDPACWRATTLNTVCNYDPDVRFILDAPPGSAFSRSPEGTFVKNELEEAFLDAFESEYDEALDDAFTEILNSPEDLEAFRNQLEAVFEGGLADATADSAAKHNLSEEEIHEFKSMFREAFNDACSEVLGKSAHLEPMGEKPQSEWSDSLSEEAKKALADAEILQMLAGGHAGHGNGSGRRDN